MNPSSYVLREMEKTNIWPSAVGFRLLNDCAAGKEHRTLTMAVASHLAKCDNFCSTPRPSYFYISCVSARDCKTVPVDVYEGLCLCVHVCLSVQYVCVCYSHD